MLFNSPLFLLGFLPIFLIAYFVVPGIRLRNILIVLFSTFFFAWGDPLFCGYVIAGTGIDYLIIKHVLCKRSASVKLRQIALVAAVMINISALLFFKYANFFVDQFQPLLQLVGMPTPSWYGVALPLGISFIAFHKISFVLDLYKQRISPPSSFIDALVYVLFFPQLIAGPIVRYYDIGHQIRARSHSSDEFIAGFFRFTRGLAKKMLIADPAGLIANAIFSLQPESLPTHYVWLGVLAYTIQIYFDFSGYSDMAIGLARIVGFKFPENFNQPYTARSVTEFWQRWHMTLSKWMLVYLYIPLGGNQVSQWRMYFNLWIVFLISGFWHGAAWTFIFWGAYFGFFLMLEKFCDQRGWVIPLPKVFRQLLTFIVIMNSWVLFRAESLEYAIGMFGRMYGLTSQLQVATEPFALIFPPHGLAVILLGLAIAVTPLSVMPKLPQKLKDSIMLDTALWIISILLFVLSLSSILAAGSSSFLYFRF
jgi:alginate O-acetyltransferase complex protein AlgI